MLEIIEECQPDILAIEKMFFMQNKDNALKVAESRGVIVLAASMHNLVIQEYSPNEIKKCITGYGKAEKKQVQWMVTELLKLESTPEPDDTADALAIALTCGFEQAL